MKRRMVVGAFALGLFVFSGCASSEHAIALSDVPEAVLEAAQEAVPGLVLTEAEVEETEDGLVYEVEGTAEGKEYELEITADGRVLEVEEE